MKRTSPARQKIIDAATELFYQHGYQATTVDHVIERSGISKPTVYSHFSTKEQLCVAYLQEMRAREHELLKAAIRREKTPKERFLAIIKHVRSRVIDADFRGCGFFNMISEISDRQSPIVKEAKIYVDMIRDTIRDVVIELKNSSKEYRGIDVDELADDYYVIVAGAIMASQEYKDAWPTDRAIKQVERLLA